jgi:agmatine/peptidylarginine deiminase
MDIAWLRDTGPRRDSTDASHRRAVGYLYDQNAKLGGVILQNAS